ncbi:MAG: efflux transporter outer membrane subunit [Dongiaceae bacterium]
MNRARLRVASVALLLILPGCMVGPDYHRPSAPMSATFKEAQGWRVAQPSDAINRGPWWSVYKDPVLDQLESQVNFSNQTLKADEAAYRQAQAIVSEGRAGLAPTVLVNPQVNAQQTLALGANSRTTPVTADAQIAAQVDWDLDVWGRIRRTVESDVASAQASAGDLATAQLSAQSALATDYLQLREADELTRLLDASVTAFTKSLQIVQNQYEVGVAARSDVATAQTQVQQTQAQEIDVGVRRAQLEHAIAVLIGKPPADLTIAPMPFAYFIPDIPLEMPSALLERRPDVAAAERRMAAANAQIGIAVAAYYPDISLSAALGIGGAPGSEFISASQALWSVGANITETVFDAGLRHAEVTDAREIYEQAVANYRQTVLTSFQQTEDELAALRILAQEATAQDAAVKSAQLAQQLALNEYQAGTTAYTTVVVAQTAALSDEETALNIWQSRLTASVALIEALGGGWDAHQLPSRREVEKEVPDAKDKPAPASTAISAPAPGKIATAEPKPAVAQSPDLSIAFDANNTDLPPAGTAALDQLVTKMTANKNLRVQVMAYASGTPDTEEVARSTSLARGLAVRQYLYDKGIPSTRVEVRALGLKGNGADRVDVVPAS